MNRPLVPVYFHPAIARQDWHSVECGGPKWRGVVVNVADGPGSARNVDLPWSHEIQLLRGLQIQVLGYVDVGYGARALEDIWVDVARWRMAYAVDGMFLDRFPVVPGQAMFDLIQDLRSAGAPFVAANPGVMPDAYVLTWVDACVTFEGTWETYRDLHVSGWTRSLHVDGLVHLVHSTPAEHHSDVLELAAARGADVYVTESGGPNPWDRVSSTFAVPTASHHDVSVPDFAPEQR